jgi:cation-transporting ATPase E
MHGPPEEQVRGLTSAQARERARAGEANVTHDRGARPLSQIIRSNTMTIFNLVIGVMWVLMLVTAPFQDTLFGFIIVINAAIGIVQEYRASRTLAKLSLVGAARPVVVRDGEEVDVASEEVVRDDVILLRAGDQIVVDGPVLWAAGMQVDESLLTGEADPVNHGVGDELLSGSFVVAGSGAMRADRVGPRSYAAGLAAQARVYTPTKSELMSSIMRFVRIMTYLLLPISAALFVSQVRASPDISDAIAGTIAGVVTMIPEGLVLLTSVAMAVAVIRLGQANALVQELPAVEVLARVDVLCIDKTGTLTEPGMVLRETVSLDGSGDLPRVLAGLGAAEEVPNPTLAAVAAAHPAAPEVLVDEVVPFSSDRKWSAAALADSAGVPPGSDPPLGAPSGPDAAAAWAGWWVIGAPELVCAADPDGCAEALARAAALAVSGARVLLVARPSGIPAADRPLPPVRPVGLLVIDQALRPDAADTVAWFAREGVALKVLSGDNPATVAAIAAQAGIEGAAGPVDARTLPEDAEGLAEVMESTSVFGRVSPEQKRGMVDALQSRGHVVAMTGDGVNDVLALKRADLGIAMGSGAGASRSVAQIVLVDNRFATMPGVVAEGRRVLGNIERVSDLFLNKSFYATALALMTVVLTVPYPFLPRHSTIINALTIGVPAFLLALMPNEQRFRPGFVRRVLSWAIPSGLVCAVAAMSSYGLDLLASRGARDRGELSSVEAVTEARVAAAITLFLAAWWVLVLISRPLDRLRAAIVVAMALGFVLVLAIPPVSDFLALSLGPDRGGGVAVGVALIAMGVLSVLHRIIRSGPRARWW